MLAVSRPSDATPAIRCSTGPVARNVDGGTRARRVRVALSGGTLA